MTQNKLYGVVLGQGCVRGEILRACDYPEAYGEGVTIQKGRRASDFRGGGGEKEIRKGGYICNSMMSLTSPESLGQRSLKGAEAGYKALFYH